MTLRCSLSLEQGENGGSLNNNLIFINFSFTSARASLVIKHAYYQRADHCWHFDAFLFFHGVDDAERHPGWWLWNAGPGRFLFQLSRQSLECRSFSAHHGDRILPSCLTLFNWKEKHYLYKAVQIHLILCPDSDLQRSVRWIWREKWIIKTTRRALWPT